MGQVTFKKFVEFVDLSEEQINEEQINEIFGLFKNDAKVQQLIAQRAKLRAAKIGANKALQAEKDKLFAAARAKLAAQSPYVKRLTPKQMSAIKDKIWKDVAAELRAADLKAASKRA